MDKSDFNFDRIVQCDQENYEKKKCLSKSKFPADLYNNMMNWINLNKIEYNDFILSALVLLWMRYAQSDLIKIPLIDSNALMAKIVTVDCNRIKTFQSIVDIVTNCDEKYTICDIFRYLSQYANNVGLLEFFGGFTDDVDKFDLQIAKNIILIEKDSTNPFIYAVSEGEESGNFAEQLIVHFSNLIVSIVECNGYNQDIYKLSMLGALEKEKIIYKWNNTKHEFNKKCIHELIEEKSKENENAIAVIYKGKEYSRLKINNFSNYVAYELNKVNVRKGDIIAVLLEKSVYFVTAILGILKTGAAYLPIDVNYPNERINFILADAGVKYIIADQKYTSKLTYSTEIIYIDETDMNAKAKYFSSGISKDLLPVDGLCYVIYTSGSTGNPKGVMLNHLGRVNNFSDFNYRFGIDEGDKLLAISSTGFDMCAYDILGILAAGASIVIPDPELSMQPIYWLRLIEKYKITIWHSVPVMLELLCKFAKVRNKYNLDCIRLFLLGGDWISVQLPNVVRQFSKGTFVSLGGATEVSMDSIIYIVDKVQEKWKSIPYGKPMSNQKAYILGRHLEPLPIGVIGELYIGGIGVGDGYLHNKKLTDEKFLQNPWCNKEKIYKTGDLVRFYPDGNIELLGRKDHQIKINGIRIEIGEIEDKIRKKNNIKDAVVIALEGDNHKKRIIAYIVMTEDKHETEKSMVAYLLNKLPKAFIPTRFIFLEQLPLTPNGKVNRKKLVELAVEKECIDNEPNRTTDMSDII